MSFVRTRRALLAAALGLAAVALPLLAAEPVYEPIVVRDAWLAQPPPGTEVIAGYVELTAAETDRLRGATSTFARRVELHAHEHVDGVMKMRKLDEGVALPAGQAVKLEPHGLHLMLFDPEHRPEVGEKIWIGLDFEQAGSVSIAFEVRDARVLD